MLICVGVSDPCAVADGLDPASLGAVPGAVVAAACKSLNVRIKTKSTFAVSRLCRKDHSSRTHSEEDIGY